MRPPSGNWIVKSVAGVGCNGGKEPGGQAARSRVQTQCLRPPDLDFRRFLPLQTSHTNISHGTNDLHRQVGTRPLSWNPMLTCGQIRQTRLAPPDMPNEPKKSFVFNPGHSRTNPNPLLQNEPNFSHPIPSTIRVYAPLFRAAAGFERDGLRAAKALRRKRHAFAQADQRSANLARRQTGGLHRTNSG